MIDFIYTHSWIFITLIALLGLMMGSFLNVVIHRLPLMLERDWQRQCLEFVDHIPEFHGEMEHYNLAYPPSYCPFCRSKLTVWQNIPILSYLMLGGKCATCEKRIPFRYMLVELLSCILAIISAIQFGPSIELWAVLFLTWFLIAIIFIDIDHQIIPDRLTIPLIWIGLFFSCFTLFSTSHDAILGVILGYLFFWFIEEGFNWITKKEGIGQGDFKLLAAAGAWLGWQLLPFVILTSSLLALIVGGLALLLKRQSKDTPIPFGPFIAIAIWLGIVWGFDITQSYLQLFGITWSNV